MTTDYLKKFKLQTWREKKYSKTTNEMGRWFPGGWKRPSGLSLIDNDDDEDDDDEEEEEKIAKPWKRSKAKNWRKIIKVWNFDQSNIQWAL